MSYTNTAGDFSGCFVFFTQPILINRGLGLVRTDPELGQHIIIGFNLSITIIYGILYTHKEAISLTNLRIYNNLYTIMIIKTLKKLISVIIIELFLWNNVIFAVEPAVNLINNKNASTKSTLRMPIVHDWQIRQNLNNYINNRSQQETVTYDFDTLKSPDVTIAPFLAEVIISILIDNTDKQNNINIISVQEKAAELKIADIIKSYPKEVKDAISNQLIKRKVLEIAGASEEISEIGKVFGIEELVKNNRPAEKQLKTSNSRIIDKEYITTVRQGKYDNEALKKKAFWKAGVKKIHRIVFIFFPKLLFSKDLNETVKDFDLWELIISNWQIFCAITAAVLIISFSKLIRNARTVHRLKSIKPEIREKAARNLGKIGWNKNAKLLINVGTNDESTKARISAIKSLGQIGDKRAIESLISILSAPKYVPVLEAAVIALGKIGDKRAIRPILEKGLKAPYHAVRVAAVKALKGFDWHPETDEEKSYWYLAEQDWEALIKLGKPALNVLINRGLRAEFKNQNGEVRKAAMETLAKMGRNAVEPLINIGLKNKDETIRESAVEVLVKIGEASVEPLINIGLVESPAEAAKALSKMRMPITEQLINIGLRHENTMVRLACANLLNGKMGDKDVNYIKAIILSDKSWQVREALVKVIERVGGYKRSFLIGDQKYTDIYHMLTNKDSLRKVKKIDTYLVKNLIKTGLKDEDEDFRAATREALSTMDRCSCKELLDLAINNEDVDSRNTAIELLIEIGLKNFSSEAQEALIKIGTSAVEPLINTGLNNKNNSIVNYSVKILGEIGDKRALEPLLETGASTEDIYILIGVIEALGKMRNISEAQRKAAARFLIDTGLNHKYDDVKNKAAQVLKIAGDSTAIEPLINIGFASGGKSSALAFNSQQALKAIGKNEGPKIIDMGLKNENPAVRKNTAEMMGLPIDGKTNITHTSVTLEETAYWFFAKQDWKKIVELGADSVEPLINLGLKSADRNIRVESIKALGKIGDARAVEPLLQMGLESKDIYFTHEIIEALGEIRDARAVETLLTVWLPDKDTRLEAAEALGKMTSKETDNILIKEMTAAENDIYFYKTVIKSLGRKGNTGAVRFLIDKGLQHPDWDVVETAAEALGKIGDARAILPLINRGFRAGEAWENRSKVTFALRKFGAAAVEPLINTGMADTDYNVRLNSILTLSNSNDVRIIEPMINIGLKDKRGSISSNAEFALENIGEAAIEPLINIGLKHENAHVCQSAVNILKKLAFHPRTEDEKIYLYLAEGRRVELASSLVEEKFKGSVAALAKIGLNHKNNDIREKTVTILEKLNWQPETPQEKVCYYLSKQDWKELIKIGSPAIDGLVKTGLKDISVSGMVRETLKSIYVAMDKDGRRLTENQLGMLIKANNTRHMIFIINNYSSILPRVVPDGFASLQKLCIKIQEEVGNYPQADRERLLIQLSSSIDKYIEHFVGDGEIKAIAEECKDINSLMAIVHDNLQSCLDSLGNINKRVDDFAQLRKVLPLNNPLTRIIRMLGEEGTSVENYCAVTKDIIAAGNFDVFYNMILDAAKRRQREAPQEIAGILEILKDKNTRNWKEQDWMLLKEQIQRYYDNGFKVITKYLFDYFVEHEGDNTALVGMKQDIEEEFSGMAWGDFFGLSNEFKGKYNIDPSTELALISKYMPCSNLTAKDYMGKYEQIKAEIEKRQGSFQKEVGQNLRTLYSLNGSRSQQVYNYKTDSPDKDELNQRLVGYINVYTKGTFDKTLMQYVFDKKKNSVFILKQEVLSFITNGYRDVIDPTEFLNIPVSDSAQIEWLNAWYRFLADTLKNDSKNSIRECIKSIIGGFTQEQIDALDKKYQVSAAISLKDGQHLSQQIVRGAVTDKILNSVIDVFESDIADINSVLSCYETIEVKTKDKFYVGFFDDLLHLMSFMMTGVCTWTEVDKRVTEEKKHFGTIALKDHEGRVFGASQVQLLKDVGIQGISRGRSSSGFRVLALPGINLYQGEIGMHKERAVLAILESAQRLAQENNLEGAIIPADAEIYSNNTFEKQFIQELLQRGWLKKVNLTDNVYFALKYNYKEVYLIQIPKEEEVLSFSDADCIKSEEDSRLDRLEREEAVTLGEGFGQLVYEKDAVPQSVVNALKDAIDKMFNDMPQEIIFPLKTQINIYDFDFNVRIDQGRDTSYINLTESGIEISIGKDILYEDNKVETITLIQILSESIAAILLNSQYNFLKEDSEINENAYFKLEIIKALLSYKYYLGINYKLICGDSWNKYSFLTEKSSDEVQNIMKKYKTDLDKSTKGVKNIKQWNLFFRIVDDETPGFILTNYIHVLFNENDAVSTDTIANIIRQVCDVDISQRVSIVRIRNVYKDFLLDGKVFVRRLDKMVPKEIFDNFDDTENLVAIRDILYTTDSENEFYQNLGKVMKYMFPFAGDDMDTELSSFFNKDIFRAPDRQQAVKDALISILNKYVGQETAATIKEYLIGNRVDDNNKPKVIPYIDFIPEGAQYDFLRYESPDGIDWSLVTGDGITPVEEQGPNDWIKELFVMKENMSNSGPRDRGIISKMGVQADLSVDLQKLDFLTEREGVNTPFLRNTLSTILGDITYNIVPKSHPLYGELIKVDGITGQLCLDGQEGAIFVSQERHENKGANAQERLARDLEHEQIELTRRIERAKKNKRWKEFPHIEHANTIKEQYRIIEAPLEKEDAESVVSNTIDIHNELISESFENAVEKQPSSAFYLQEINKLINNNSIQSDNRYNRISKENCLWLHSQVDSEIAAIRGIKNQEIIEKAEKTACQKPDIETPFIIDFKILESNPGWVEHLKGLKVLFYVEGTGEQAYMQMLGINKTQIIRNKAALEAVIANIDNQDLNIIGEVPTDIGNKLLIPNSEENLIDWQVLRAMIVNLDRILYIPTVPISENLNAMREEFLKTI